MEEPTYWPLTVAVLPMHTVIRLTIVCRKHAAAYNPKEFDTRDSLDYNPRSRELVNFLRHTMINRSTDCYAASGYALSYDNMVWRINRDFPESADQRVKNLKAHILLLIKEHYPALKIECDHQLYQLENPEAWKNEDSATTAAATTHKVSHPAGEQSCHAAAPTL